MFKDYSGNVLKDIERKKRKFLLMTGVDGVENWVRLSPVVTGLYKNAVMFNTSWGRFSPFGTASGEDGGIVTPKKTVSRPNQQDTIRVGVNLVYAQKVEDIHDTGLKAMDYSRVNYSKLAKLVF